MSKAVAFGGAFVATAALGLGASHALSSMTEPIPRLEWQRDALLAALAPLVVGVGALVVTKSRGAAIAGALAAGAIGAVVAYREKKATDAATAARAAIPQGP